MKHCKSIWRSAALLPAVLPFIFTLVFAACDNPMEPNSGESSTAAAPVVQTGKASVNFSIQGGGASRTVMPEIPGELSYTLTGAKDGGAEQQLAEFTGSEIAALSLDAGVWNFTLIAEDAEENIVLKAETSETLAADQSKDVVFTLMPLKEGSGAINISFSYPPDAGISRVEVTIDGSLDEIINLSSANGAWSYQKIDEEVVAAEDYFAVFSFYSGSRIAALVTETIQVRRNLTSKKTITLTLDDLKNVVKVAGDTLAEKLQWLTYYAENDTNYIVEVTDDEAIASGILYIYGDTGVSITLTGIGAERTVSLSTQGVMFSVDSGVTLTLDNNITLAGRDDNLDPLVRVNNGGTLVLNTGAKITGNTAPSAPGGVYVYNGGTFTMNGGEISGNTAVNVPGGGVFVDAGGTFTKTGGVIYGDDGTALSNSASNGGHAVYWDTGFIPLYRNTTLGEGDSLSTTDPNLGWEAGVTSIVDGWNPGNIEIPGGEQWFTFTASAESQYVHVKFGALDDLYVAVYDNDFQQIEDANLYDSTTYKNVTGLDVDETYYIRVWPYYDADTGDYEILVNQSPLTSQPEALETGWNPGNIETPNGEQWFSFTAGDAARYAHVRFGALNNLYARVYDSDIQDVGDGRTDLWGNITYMSLSGLNSGETYYIRIGSNGGSGDYEIQVNEYPMLEWTEPPELAAGWNPGGIEAGGENWFKHIASAESRYVHVRFGDLNDLMLEFYTGDMARIHIGNVHFSGSTTFRDISDIRSPGETYYFRVVPYNTGDSGNYEIMVSDSIFPEGPPPELEEQLVAGVWKDGNIETTGGADWFKFTATDAPEQYIHVQFGGLDDLYVQVFTGDWQEVGSRSNLYNNTIYKSLSGLTPGEYYIRVWPYYGADTGDYKIAFNDTSTPPPDTP